MLQAEKSKTGGGGNQKRLNFIHPCNRMIYQNNKELLRTLTPLTSTPHYLHPIFPGPILSNSPTLFKLLEKEVKKPIHPSEVFDMIVGTSTGAIIAMSLLAGKETEDGRRQPMSLKDIAGVYLQ